MIMRQTDGVTYQLCSHLFWLSCNLNIHRERVEPHRTNECYPRGEGIHHLQVRVYPDSWTEKMNHFKLWFYPIINILWNNVQNVWKGLKNIKYRIYVIPVKSLNFEKILKGFCQNCLFDLMLENNCSSWPQFYREKNTIFSTQGLLKNWLILRCFIISAASL